MRETLDIMVADKQSDWTGAEISAFVLTVVNAFAVRNYTFAKRLGGHGLEAGIKLLSERVIDILRGQEPDFDAILNGPNGKKIIEIVGASLSSSSR